MTNLHLAGTPDPAHRIAVVTAGLSEPSSTRLLADLLGDAAADALGEGARSTWSSFVRWHTP